MERTAFLATDGPPWWLSVPADRRMEEARRELGTTLGWTENEWFADLHRREALFEFLQTSGLQLLSQDLDALYNDEARLQWVESVRQLAEPPPPAIDGGTAGRSGPLLPATSVGGAAGGTARHPHQEEIGVQAQELSRGNDVRVRLRPVPPRSGAAKRPGRSQLETATQAVISDLAGGGLGDLARELESRALPTWRALSTILIFERRVREEAARLVGA